MEYYILGFISSFGQTNILYPESSSRLKTTNTWSREMHTYICTSNAMSYRCLCSNSTCYPAPSSFADCGIQRTIYSLWKVFLQCTVGINDKIREQKIVPVPNAPLDTPSYHTT